MKYSTKTKLQKALLLAKNEG